MVSEGENDVETLVAGAAARSPTRAAQGTGGRTTRSCARHVVMIEDNDQAGRKRGQTVALSLTERRARSSIERGAISLERVPGLG